MSRKFGSAVDWAAPGIRVAGCLCAAVFAQNPIKQGVARCWHIIATLRLPATPMRVVRLIDPRIYACVIGARGDTTCSNV